ncbi:hypothetical protein EQZ23_06845 [Sphingomonas sp. UV9]|uniref:hypothetical protein n=1 Tax=Sphingomonas sp. UV9 TaxID=1851410 RepID=UPI000FFC443F|nr:hypothetical protein [Sphingomonas sp. UV9]RXD04853.1 hypothetical protein EQZ23_06845 [Sphingomonas sp. UV9]
MSGKAKGVVPPRAPDGLPDIPHALLDRAYDASNWTDTLRQPPPEWNPLPDRAVFEESARGFAGRSGRPAQAVYAAILFGFISGYVRLDPGRDRLAWTVRLSNADETMDDVMSRLDALKPALPTVALRRWYNDARKSAGHASKPVPMHWIESLAAQPEFDGDTADGEITALIRCDPDEPYRVSALMDEIRTGLVRGAKVDAVQGDVRAALRRALDTTVPTLRDTFVDPLSGDEFEAPTAQLAGRLLAIDANHRSLAIAVMADAMANAELAFYSRIPLAMHRLSIVLERVQKGDIREVRRRVRAYLDGRILPKVSPSCRVRDISELMAAERRIGEWIAEPSTSPELKEWLRANRPDVPRDRTFFKALLKLRTSLDASGLKRRRERADVIADNFDGMLVEIAAVTADAKEIWETAESAHKKADHADEPFSVELKQRDAGFGDTGDTFCLDLNTMNVRRQIELLNAVAVQKKEGEVKNFLQAALKGKTRYGDGSFLEQRVVIVDRTKLMVAIEEHQQLAFLEPYVYGCTLRPRFLPDQMLQERRDYMVATGLPGPRLAPNNVIVGDSGEMRKLMIWSLALRNEVVLPVTSLYRGMAIANFNYRLMAVGHMRISTARQAIDDQSRGWTTVGGRSAMIGIPKLPHEVRILPRSRKIREFPVDAATITAFVDAVAITVHVEGGDTAHPKRVRIARVPIYYFMPKECGDDRYVSQFNGRLMGVSHIRYCISFAFGRQVQPHDPRHGGATKRADEGHKLEDIGNAIGTRSHVLKRYTTRGKGSGGPGTTDRWLRTRDGMAQLGSDRTRK